MEVLPTRSKSYEAYWICILANFVSPSAIDYNCIFIKVDFYRFIPAAWPSQLQAEN
jgi:hypothetical protein